MVRKGNGHDETGVEKAGDDKDYDQKGSVKDEQSKDKPSIEPENRTRNSI
jgi:hypothetical protein